MHFDSSIHLLQFGNSMGVAATCALDGRRPIIVADIQVKLSCSPLLPAQVLLSLGSLAQVPVQLDGKGHALIDGWHDMGIQRECRGLRWPQRLHTKG